MDGLVCLGDLGKTALRQMLDRFRLETAQTIHQVSIFMMI